jgi:hemoglobin-like flavoprotein
MEADQIPAQPTDLAMTTREIFLLKSSFRRIAPNASQTAALFFARLFELDPALRELFTSDMGRQGRRLMQMIGYAVSGLDHPETLAPTFRQLGQLHAAYHVKESHYETAGTALLWALGKVLGEGFTEETCVAWGKTYWLLAETMKAGARDANAMRNRAVA